MEKNKSNMEEGSFVLVKLCSEKNKNQNIYRYVGICQEIDYDEDEVKILFLKLIGNKQATDFQISEEVKFIPKDNILSILKEPKLCQRGDRVYYQFNTNVDVFEKP